MNADEYGGNKQLQMQMISAFYDAKLKNIKMDEYALWCIHEEENLKDDEFIGWMWMNLGVTSNDWRE